ncbi:uncharacterized protein BT62DRAFT_468590 [Guyanagaster necrorhizus]|uniref:Uncharacterized protein n=1 Tax=Guyanagaster necrorhizus TaxID=856835 RepID=A0A9P8ANM0_9AGAR|nr:uncharacterized protein BT62DRAFT_468590 [Guyanagaster necrorhizus MCA 3950]KAG7441891.1 hypothetical protein BT62DRAFT_468590 [Guyanagaster necrorhizus MCA 3950]
MWRSIVTPPCMRSWLTRMLTFDSRSLYKLQITSPEDMSLCFVFRQLVNHSGLTSIIAWCKYDKFCLWSIYLTCL